MAFSTISKKNPHEVKYLNGRNINWLKPPPVRKRVQWTKKDMYGRKVTGSFRHICHLNRLNNLALKRYGVEIVIIQPAYNGTVPASKGTHDLSETVDLYIPGVSWWEQQRFFRANGLGCWYRFPPKFGNHIHGFTLPPREGKSIDDDWAVIGIQVGIYVDGGCSTRGRLITSSQIGDYYKKAFGLAYQHTAGSDRSWYPKKIEATIFDLNKYVASRARKQRKAAA